MIPYILHVALLISVCLLFYKIFLQKETFYHLNRVVLLICLALSFALPLISIPQAWTLRDVQVEKVVNVPEQIAPVVKQQLVPDKESIKQEVLAKKQILKNQAVNTNHDQDKPFLPIAIKWLFYLYWAGVAVFGLNLLLQIVVLLIRAYSNPIIKDNKFRIVEVKGDKAPCSFGNNIFINPEKYDWDTYNQILMHEKVHIQQGHSFDILLAELVLVFQWFNPFAWLYRGELENNLEFLTDEAVLDQNSVEKSSYQMSLLKVSAPHLALSVTTNYNQSLLKKRIVMMNAKKSNIHTMWKYFILVPVMGGLACALNQTIAYSQAVKNTSAKAHTNSKQVHKNWGLTDRTEGSWFATIKGERVRIEFRGDDNDHDWSSSSDDFKLGELSSVPKDQKGDFTITRDAGTMQFNGKFDGNEGFGHYKYVANKEFIYYLSNEGITNLDHPDEFAFFIININKAYVHMLKDNGYGHIRTDDMISMAALKVDEPFIKYWKQNGYPDISAEELVSAKALGVDGEYVKEIHDAGYPKISYEQLISFKAQGITGAYIRGLKKAGKVEGKDNDGNGLPSAEDISSYKALNVDSTYIEGLKNAGYANISFNELTSMKALGITPEYVKSFEDIGYKNISANDLQSLKALDITPEYVKGFIALGYNDISMDHLSSFKALGVTAEFVRGILALGYKQVSPDELGSLKALGVTPGFIKGFKDIGFSDVSLDEISSLKATGVTPGYVSEMKAKGFNSKDLDKYIQMKNAFN